jgi:hypothetical protein
MTIATTGLSRTYRDSGTVLNKHDKAWRRRNRRKSCRPASPAEVRECEINKVIDHVFGASLPDDDYGREVLYELLNQLALRGAGLDEMRDHAIDLLPEMGDDDSIDTMVKTIGKGRRRGADQIARALGVTYQMRTFLDLRTIGACDMSKKQRDEIQAQKEAHDKRWQREQAGAAPHAQSNERTCPWDAEGISRATWYRQQAAKKAAAENAENSPCDSFGDHTLSEVLMDKSVSGETRHSAGDHVPAHAPASRLAPPRRTPSSFDQQEPEGVVIEEPASYGAVFSGAEAERARRAERIQRALAVCGRAYADQFGEPLETKNGDDESRSAERISAASRSRRA